MISEVYLTIIYGFLFVRSSVRSSVRSCAAFFRIASGIARKLYEISKKKLHNVHLPLNDLQISLIYQNIVL